MSTNPRAIAQVTTAASGLSGAGVTLDVSNAALFSTGQLVELYPSQFGDGSPIARAGQTVRYLISAKAGAQLTGTMNYDSFTNPPQVEKGWLIDGTSYDASGTTQVPLFIAETNTTSPGGGASQRNTIAAIWAPANGWGDFQLFGVSLIARPVLGGVTPGVDATVGTAMMVGAEHNTTAVNMAILRAGGFYASQAVAGSTVQELRAVESTYYATAGAVTTAISHQVRRGAAGSVGTVTSGVGVMIDEVLAPVPTNNIPIWQVDPRGLSIMSGQWGFGGNPAGFLPVSTATVEIRAAPNGTNANNYTVLRLAADNPSVVYFVRWKDAGAAGANFLAGDKVLYLSAT